MKESNSSKDLQSLLDAIKASDVVENRVQLLAELEELDITKKSEIASLIGALIFWEDFTCLDISQCTLNKAILHIAAKYLELDISGCLGEFLSLGIKASVWCGKHLKMTLMSTEESPEEEHSNLFFQLLVDMLSYAAASFSAMGRHPIPCSQEFILTIQNFISEQLNLTKDALSEIKRINAFGSEVQKVAQLILDAVVRLCKVYGHGVNWEFDSWRTQEDKKVIGSEGASGADHVINIVKYTIDKLCEVGILAANDGGSLVSVLNLSWKGVVTLLQLGKGALAAKVDVAGVILTLISMAQKSLRCAADTWSLQLKETVTMTEAKRIFLPVKFYLINAVRIISQYTTQAYSVYKEIVWCVVMISSFKVYLSKEENLRAATEALAEILEPTSFHVLNSILNSVQVKQEEKFQVLNWLFSDEYNMKSAPGVSDSDKLPNSVDQVLFSRSDVMEGSINFSLGQVNLFLDLLRSSSDLEDNVKLWLARKLQWLLDILVNEDVYSASLSLQVTISRQSQEFAYQTFFYSSLNALKTFMVVMSSSTAWGEIESFLLANLVHPHILCWEIITELLGFVMRYAETDMVNDIIDKLCSLLVCTGSPEALASPASALRKIARSICVIVTHCSKAGDQVYNYIIADNKSQYSPIMHIALLMEGFPLNLLSERKRSIAKERVLTEYFSFVESFGSELPKASGFEIYGAPVYALSATVQSLQVSISDTEMKTLRFLVAIIEKYKKSEDSKLKDIYRRLLSEVLVIISNMKHVYSCYEMERVILELQNLFISRPTPSASDSLLFHCKPNLANFMAGLGHVELAENDDDERSSAVWKLYHMLLREQHWAFIHLALTAFGYFAARTSCNQLWRFVPQDAALSFDLESGNEADEDRFMSELKAFLEKESAPFLTKPTPDHIEKLVREGLKLKEIHERNADINEEVAICDSMEIDEENQGTRKRKLPDGISKGVELLQSGMKVMGEGLSQWQRNQIGLTEIHDRLLTHFSRLEDVVSHLVSLTDES